MKPNINRPERNGFKRQRCLKCGAIRVDKQIGLEQTPGEYVSAMVQVFREVWRVLRDDGTVWLVIGDSYVSKATGSLGNYTGSSYGFGENHKHQAAGSVRPDKTGFGLAEKNLIGIPWRVAFALQTMGSSDIQAMGTIERVRCELLDEYNGIPIPDKVINVLERLDREYADAKGDSFWLRQDIIWAKACSGNIRKGSAMPESVKDRFQKAHEYVFLLTKSPKYYFDNEAVKDRVDKAKSHEYNNGYENKSVYSMQNRKASGDVQCQQPAVGRFDGLLQGLSENNSQGVGLEVQRQQEGKGDGKALLLFGKGTSDKEDIQGKLRTNRRTTREIPKGWAKTRKGSKIQEKKEALRPKREGQSDQSNSGQAVRQDRQGSLCETQDSNKEELSNQNNRLHVDQNRVGGTQGCVQEQVCLLRSAGGEAGNGACDSIEQRGITQKRECGSIVQDVQCQEGSKVAGNRRSVWLINIASYSGAHYAVFPPNLIEPCILAGCPPKVCAKCGKPWVRVVENIPMGKKLSERTAAKHEQGLATACGGAMTSPPISKTLGWQPTCKCDAGTRPGVVLDPFVGSGTTCLVAQRHGRDAIGLDLSFEYLNTNSRTRLGYGDYVPVDDGVKQLTIGGLIDEGG